MSDMNVVNLKKEDLAVVLPQTERILRSGGIVIGPTDTVYGIFCDARNGDAVQRIFELKQRHEEKALPIFVKDIAMARKYAYISDAKVRFLEKVWPGAVTVVFQHKDKLPPVLMGELATIGIRIPNHPFMLKLLSRLDFPLAQTSANVSGRPPAKNLADVEVFFGNDFMRRRRINLIIDGGELGWQAPYQSKHGTGQASTVIDFTRDEPFILRSGIVTKQELDHMLNNF